MKRGVKYGSTAKKKKKLSNKNVIKKRDNKKETTTLGNKPETLGVSKRSRRSRQTPQHLLS